MTQKDKIKYFSIGLSIMKYGFKEKDIDLIVRLYDLICEKKGQTDLMDIAKVEEANDNAYPVQKLLP